MVWQIALMVWLLAISAAKLTWITAPDKFLGALGIIVVIIYLIELLYSHRETWLARF